MEDKESRGMKPRVAARKTQRNREQLWKAWLDLEAKHKKLYASARSIIQNDIPPKEASKEQARKWFADLLSQAGDNRRDFDALLEETFGYVYLKGQ